MAKIVACTLPEGLNFEAFFDGYDDGFKHDVDDSKRYMLEIRGCGSQTIKDIILKSLEKGNPVTSLVYTLLLPWVAEVARELHLPSALLWIQPKGVKWTGPGQPGTGP
ncbi:Crocetin glucosyltransferase, chloroplastic [Capsicum baccatum]|uniref:Crocetin glucosyltransferase, chloroplastic n=1 Tax=Capsicum baccatum TaxID=33114 RepID=A0A2G2X359_CAPBA|nr:Crocetin glucosyltransferase, chloroplastic [Capsicum baccatum]